MKQYTFINKYKTAHRLARKFWAPCNSVLTLKHGSIRYKVENLPGFSRLFLQMRINFLCTIVRRVKVCTIRRNIMQRGKRLEQILCTLSRKPVSENICIRQISDVLYHFYIWNEMIPKSDLQSGTCLNEKALIVILAPTSNLLRWVGY